MTLQQKELSFLSMNRMLLETEKFWSKKEEPDARRKTSPMVLKIKTIMTQHHLLPHLVTLTVRDLAVEIKFKLRGT